MTLLERIEKYVRLQGNQVGSGVEFAEILEDLADPNQRFHFEVYSELPETGEGNVLYLIGPTEDNKYEEYIYYDGSFTKIGDTTLDLSGYPTTEQMNAAVSAAVAATLESVALTFATKTEVNEKEAAINAEISQLGQEVDELQLAFNVLKSEDDVKTDLAFDVEIGYEDLALTDANGYIVRKSTGKVESGSTNQGILYFPVVAGKSYRINLNELYCQSAYSTISFSQSVPAVNVETTLIWSAPSTGDQTETIDYNATQNGYVFVLYNAVAQKTRITGQRKTTTYGPKFFTASDIDTELITSSTNPVQNKVVANKINELQSELYEAVEISIPVVLTDANGFIVRKSTNKVESGSTNQGIMYFPVQAGHTYKINLNNLYCVNAYSIVSFSTTAPVVNGATTLLYGVEITGEYTEIIIYTPSIDGYVFVLYNAVAQKTRISAIEETIVYRQKYIEKYGWEEMKWSVIGDSLTETNRRALKNYHDFVHDETGIVVQNLGAGGTGYANAGSNSNRFYNRIAQIASDADVITIFGSFNDMSVSLPLGDVSDTGFNSICGCINETLSAIQTAFPLINLGVVTPTPWASQRPTASGDSPAELYVNAIIEICKNKSIPCLDLFHCSNLRPWDADFRAVAYRRDGTYTESTQGTPGAVQVTADILEYVRVYGGLPNAQVGDWVLPSLGGVHPDERGHKLIATRFDSFLKTLLFY